MSEWELFLVCISAKIELARRGVDALSAKDVLLYESELIHTRMRILASLTAFSQEKLGELMEVFENSVDKYIQGRTRRLALLEKLRNDAFLFKRYEENLDRETEVFFSTMEELIERFKQAVSSMSFQPAEPKERL
jgi:transcriptional regulator with XRE-family HTH domain